MSTLLLTGMGQLNGLIEENNKMMVQISKLADREQREVTLLNCMVENKTVLDFLKQYRKVLSLGHPIILQFSANYLETECVQHCLDENDADHITHIKAQLMAINALYVDGVPCYQP